MGSVGNVLEWYDFALYGYFAPVLATLFFPGDSALASLLSTFGVFAIGFFARPLGAVLFGHVGDTCSRRTALVWSVMLMAVPTCLLGLLPTHDEIGVAAPLLLILLRLLQGLSVGGEFVGSMAFLVEHAPVGRRGYAGSWSEFSAQVGILLGSGTSALLAATLSHEALYAWGWRVPFLLGVLVALVAVYMRTGIEESPEFERLKKTETVPRFPLLEVLRHRRAELAQAVGIILLYAASFYLVFVYLITYESRVLAYPLGLAMVSNTLGLAVFAILVPVMGALSDRVGRRAPLLVGAAGLFLLAYPLFTLLERQTFAAILGAQLTFALLVACYAGPMCATVAELFPPQGRYTGLSVAYNLALALFGGTVPLVATFLIERSGSVLAPGWYLLACAVVSGATVLYAVPPFWRREVVEAPVSE
jgi:MHS family proline/betaine transporter-like MFS transporter